MIYAVLQAGRLEGKLLEQGLREAAAFCTDEGVTVVQLLDEKALREFLKKEMPADMICVDISGTNGISRAERLRCHDPAALLILLAEPQMSPAVYLKPSIMAASLLLKPPEPERIQQVFGEILGRITEQPGEETFLVETREARERIPFEKILYFEAREKKIYVCTKSREYGFYSTMDQLEKQLPPPFVRCHRSYLVNQNHIKSAKLAANLLQLQGDITIPLSRSYKENFRRIRK